MDRQIVPQSSETEISAQHDQVSTNERDPLYKHEATEFHHQEIETTQNGVKSWPTGPRPLKFGRFSRLLGAWIELFLLLLPIALAGQSRLQFLTRSIIVLTLYYFSTGRDDNAPQRQSAEHLR